MQLKAKFKCTSVASFAEGHQQANFQAFKTSAEDKDNEDYAVATPSAAFTIMISPGTNAHKQITEGKEYFFTISDEKQVEVEKTSTVEVKNESTSPQEQAPNTETTEKTSKEIQVEVTQQHLDENAELTAAGIKVGDKIMLPAGSTVSTVAES